MTVLAEDMLASLSIDANGIEDRQRSLIFTRCSDSTSLVVAGRFGAPPDRRSLVQLLPASVQPRIQSRFTPIGPA
jgi:hypothetical protein